METILQLGVPCVLVNDADGDSTGKQVADMPIGEWAIEDADYAAGQTFTLDGGLMMNTGQGA